MKTFTIQRLIGNLMHQGMQNVLIAPIRTKDGDERLGNYLRRMASLLRSKKHKPQLEVSKLSRVEGPFQRLIALICCEAVTADDLATYWLGGQIDAYKGIMSMAISRVMRRVFAEKLSLDLRACADKVDEFMAFIDEVHSKRVTKLDESKPLPPDVLVSALQDKVHTDVGNLKKAEAIKLTKCKDGVCNLPVDYFGVKE